MVVEEESVPSVAFTVYVVAIWGVLEDPVMRPSLSSVNPVGSAVVELVGSETMLKVTVPPAAEAVKVGAATATVLPVVVVL